VPAQPTTLGGDVDDDVCWPISDAQALLFLSNRLARGCVRAKSANSPQVSSDGDRISRVTGGELWDGVSGRPTVSRSMDLISPSIRRHRALLGEVGSPIVSATARQEDAQRGVVGWTAAAANCGILSNCFFASYRTSPAIRASTRQGNCEQPQQHLTAAGRAQSATPCLSQAS